MTVDAAGCPSWTCAVDLRGLGGATWSWTQDCVCCHDPCIWVGLTEFSSKSNHSLTKENGISCGYTHPSIGSTLGPLFWQERRPNGAAISCTRLPLNLNSIGGRSEADFSRRDVVAIDFPKTYFSAVTGCL